MPPHLLLSECRQFGTLINHPVDDLRVCLIVAVCELRLLRLEDARRETDRIGDALSTDQAFGLDLWLQIGVYIQALVLAGADVVRLWQQLQYFSVFAYKETVSPTRHVNIWQTVCEISEVSF